MKLWCKRCGCLVVPQYWEEHRQRHRRSWLGWLLFWLLVVVALGTVAQVKAEEEKPKVEKIKGCVFLGWFNLAGDPAMRYFVRVVGDMDDFNDPDTGEPMIHGYNPLNFWKDHEGKYIPERHLEKWFIKAGGFKAVQGDGRSGLCKCPQW